MDKSVKKVRINIPMVLTWTRIALIPLIVGVFMIPTSILSMHSQNLLGCVFFIVAAVTDALDGFIARRYGMGTTLGAFLDPVADKLMVSAALIVLLAFGRVDMLVALVIIGREITVSALREWMARVGESGKVKVNWFGKISVRNCSALFAYEMIVPSCFIVAVGFAVHRNFPHGAVFIQPSERIVHRGKRHFFALCQQLPVNIFRRGVRRRGVDDFQNTFCVRRHFSASFS